MTALRRGFRALAIPVAITLLAMLVGAALGDRAGLAAWRPAVCDGGRCFCEAARPAGWAQPINTYSNLAYVLVGALILAQAGGALAASASRAAYARAFGWATIAIGLGSLLFHGTLTFAGQFADLLGMYLLSNLLLATNFARVRRLSANAFVGLYLALTALCAALMLVAPETRRVTFALGLAAALALEAWLLLRGRARHRPVWLLAGLTVFGLANWVWTLDNSGVWCDPAGLLQGHAAWHLLGALASGLAWLHYAREWEAT